MPGLFITFEGIDLCGKTTQARLLLEDLKDRGLEVVFSREPGGTPISEKIRHILLNREHSSMRPLTELLLYEASRAQHTEELIRPAIESGKCVVLDRYGDASYAYQGWGRELGPDLVRRLNELATGGLKPDLTIVLDLPPEEAAGRVKGKDWKADRLEGEEIEFHRRVREGYRQLAREEPDRVQLIDGRAAVEHLHQQILSLVLPLLSIRFPDADGGR
jgi:dTMP kinase